MDSENKKHHKKADTKWHFCQYHVVFCTKYRKSVLVGDAAEKAMELFVRFQGDVGYELVDIEVLPDRVHALIDVPPTKNLSKLIGNVKGKVAHELKREFPALRTRVPSVWTRNNLIASVGALSLDVIDDFVREQKDR